MNFKSKGILLAMEHFKITNNDTGEVTGDGLSVQYLLTDNLNPIKEGNLHGVRIIKGWLSPELSKFVEKAPAFYDFTLAMTANSSGKAKIDVKGLTYLGDIEINEKVKK